MVINVKLTCVVCCVQLVPYYFNNLAQPAHWRLVRKSSDGNAISLSHFHSMWHLLESGRLQLDLGWYTEKCIIRIIHDLSLLPVNAKKVKHNLNFDVNGISHLKSCYPNSSIYVLVAQFLRFIFLIWQSETKFKKTGYRQADKQPLQLLDLEEYG